MCTIPRLLHTWEPGQLIDELAATRCTFGCMGPTGPTPATQASQPPPADPVSTAYNEDTIPYLTTQKPQPRTVPYQPPSFNLDRPTRCLMKEERIEVHHNYISAVSNPKHKKDLINRLKQSEPHNIPTYEAEMTCHMALHNDVLGRIHTILKQDDYFRTLEELPVINGLHVYNDIQLFPKLFDTSAVIERITSEADLTEKQLNRSGMYPLPQTPLPCTSGYIPRPSSTFQPIMLAAPSPTTGEVAATPPQAQKSKEISQGSLLQCRQGIPTVPTDSQRPEQPDGSTIHQGNGSCIYKSNSQFQNHSPQQHLQQSASTVGISTPTLMVNNQLQTGPQQGQQQHPSPQTPPVSQHTNSPIRHNQFNQHVPQPLMPQVSPLMTPPQQYHPQIPPSYFHQYPPTNSPSVDSNESLLARVLHRQMDLAERQEKHDQEREEREKCKEECEK